MRYNRSCILRRGASPKFQFSKQAAKNWFHNLGALPTGAFHPYGDSARVQREKEEQFTKRCSVFLFVFKKENWVVL